MILEQIRDPEDIKKLSENQLPQLCEELRQFLIQQVSRTGGHFASNMGVVELTVAIHRCFDTSKDRLVFDVGHQAYVHKAVTGRQALFSTLRQLNGLSGFPKPYESVHDAFIAGHASNSVSVALGMARARTLQKEDYSVLALIGDGALTGGLAFEGLNNAGGSHEPLIVILNDNGMSINPNVGALTSHLSKLRTKPAYYHFKKWYRSLFGEYPMKSSIYRFNHKVKSSLKKVLLSNSSLFEDIGFTYLGPVDGHDVHALCQILQWAKESNGPVVVHVHTQKGKGYSFAEKDPGRFHGIGPFDPLMGSAKSAGGETFSGVFGKALVECAAKDERVCAITAAMESGTGLTSFAKAYPNRFFDVAIAEGHGVSMAAGMAKQGLIPVFAVYSTFLQRSYDMLIHDVSLQKLHVVLGVDRAGLVGADGETHHGCFDSQFLTGIPGFTVLCPSNFAELRSMLHKALFDLSGPTAIRYPRGGEEQFLEDTSHLPIVCLKEGTDVALISYGILINQALQAAAKLESKGISASVWKLNEIAPLPKRELISAMEDVHTMLVLEDCFEAGCVGQQITALLAESGRCPKQVILKNLGVTYAPEGKVSELEHRFGLDADGIVAAVEEARA